MKGERLVVGDYFQGEHDWQINYVPDMVLGISNDIPTGSKEGVSMAKVVWVRLALKSSDISEEAMDILLFLSKEPKSAFYELVARGLINPYAKPPRPNTNDPVPEIITNAGRNELEIMSDFGREYGKKSDSYNEFWSKTMTVDASTSSPAESSEPTPIAAK